MRILLPLLIAATLIAQTVPPPEPVAPAGTGALGDGGLRLAAAFADGQWDDGLAEVAEYTLVQRRYGHLNPGMATIIVVREHLDAVRTVKAIDADPSHVPVLKAHLVRSFQTGVYRYEQAATGFLRRADAVPLRLLLGTHEWCGLAAKSWVNRGPGSALSVISYFDGHGDLRQPLDLPSDGVLADLLPVWLRAWLATPNAPTRIALVPSQLEARTVVTAPVTADLTRTATPDGLVVTVATTSGTDRFVFTQQAPHHLRSAAMADGSTLDLIRVRRFDYWARTAPADRP